jgi:hydroxymethylpyrimidine/phosphomethylpyrimidine kinase
MTKIALTIAGSDSSGGAGIQADLRTFAFHGVHGASAIVCVTAQNTVGVVKVEAIDLATIIAQIEAVKSDLQVDAVKTGMLLERKIIEAIASYNFDNLVVDPVMVSRTGVRSIDALAIAS